VNQQIVELLVRRSFKRGEFVLASGKRSSYYVDARLSTMSGEGQVLIGRAGLAALDAQAWHPHAIGGLTLGADPIAYAIAAEATRTGRSLDAFTVRKETKAHGTGQLIEGPFVPGKPVVVVEDVITTGDSALRAVKALRDAGSEVLGVLAVVDREEGGTQRLQQEGLSVVALARIAELLQSSSS